VKHADSWEPELTSGGSGPSRLLSQTIPPREAAPTEAEAPERRVAAFELDHAADQELGIGRAVLRGSLIGFAIVATIAWVIARFAGFDNVDALGVGAFAGLWGGPGFGGMMGATLAASRAHD
jgi:hypothetical protein